MGAANRCAFGRPTALIQARNVAKTYRRGGVLGCILVLAVNGLTTGTMNFQTFSRMSFAFRITPELLAGGFGFALAMGRLGGLPPAVRAARMPVGAAPRDL